MSRLTDAIAARDFVKERLPLDRSDNKFVRQDRSQLAPADRMARRTHNREQLEAIRGHARFPTRGQARPADFVEYGRAVLDAGYGNCLEMSCAVIWYLNQLGRFDYDMVYYPDRDHVFVVIGQARNGQDIPSDFTDWDPDAVICDPWADIVCPAREYPARWRARMSNWRIMGLSLANHLPTDAQWFNIVDRDKASYLAA